MAAPRMPDHIVQTALHDHFPSSPKEPNEASRLLGNREYTVSPKRPESITHSRLINRFSEQIHTLPVNSHQEGILESALTIIDYQPTAHKSSVFLALNRTTHIKNKSLTLALLKERYEKRLVRIYQALGMASVGTPILVTLVSFPTAIMMTHSMNAALAIGAIGIAPILGCAVVSIAVSTAIACRAKAYSNKLLQNTDVTSMNTIFSEILSILEQIDDIELNDQEYPKELTSLTQTKSLRDPIFVDSYKYPVSAREFYECVERGCNFPHTSQALTSHIISPDKYNDLQKLQLMKLQTAFEIFDNATPQRCRAFLDGLNEEEKFW